MNGKRFVTSMVSALYFGSLIGLTFVPASTTGVRAFWLWPLVLFIPVGFLLTLLLTRHRWWAAIAFGVMGAAWIEVAQVIWMPDGYASITDLALSSAGAIAGVIIAAIVTAPRKSMRSHDAHRIMSQSGNREIPQD